MLSFLELAILGLIRQEPRSGYDLRRVFATTPMGHFSDSPGAIYPAVSRLVSRGLLRTVAKERKGRERTVLHLTRPGVQELLAALRAPLRPEDIVRDPDAQMLRFTFLLVEGDLEAASRFLEEYAAMTAAEAASLERYRQQMLADGAGPMTLPLEQGIALYRARSRWAKAAHRRLAGRRVAL
jgi:DNA-binding PadR family transcriptional regulator